MGDFFFFLMLMLKGKSLGDSSRNQRKDRSKSINHCPVVIVEVSSSGAVWKVRTDNICFRRLGIRSNRAGLC